MAENKKIIDALTVEDEFDKFLRKDALDVHETNRLVHTVFKQVRNEREHSLTQFELLKDMWETHHGPITKDNVPAFVRAVFRFARRIQAIANAKREAAEWRAMQGPLAEGWGVDTPMGDMPGDGDFADALIKDDASLKQFRKDLV